MALEHVYDGCSCRLLVESEIDVGAKCRIIIDVVGCTVVLCHNGIINTLLAICCSRPNTITWAVGLCWHKY